MFHSFVYLLLLIPLIFTQPEEEFEDKSKNSKTYDGPDNYQNLLDWLKDSGKAQFNKVEIDIKHEGNRGLRAKQFISRGEWALFIPRTHFLTIDEAKKSCLINRKMIQLNVQPLSSQTYFANLMMQEQRRKKSFWKPYLNVLPTDVSGYPTYFQEEELALLKGSPTLETVMNQRQQFKEEYDNLVDKIPEMTKFKYLYDNFLKLRILINSRYYTVRMNDDYVQILVPLADFANYDPKYNLEYDYSPQYDGFFLQANRDIRRGEELFTNYGKMSNKYFFMNYGFALDSISMNQFDFTMCLKKDDPLYDLKLQLTSGNACHGQRLVNETDHGTFREAIGVARFHAVTRLDEFFDLEQKAQGYRQFHPGWHLYPITTNLERKMWVYFKQFLQESYNNFASTIEDDIRMLQDPELPEYRKHIITVTMKEKQIIRNNIEVCDLALEIVEKSGSELNNQLKFAKYQRIAGYVRQELLAMKMELNE